MLEFFPLGSGAFFLGLGLDVLEPFAQGMDFHAVVDHLFAAHLRVEVVEFIDGGTDFLDGFAVVFVGYELGAHGPGLHHNRLGPELLKAAAYLLLRGVVLHKV